MNIIVRTKNSLLHSAEFKTTIGCYKAETNNIKYLWNILDTIY